MATYAIGDVQGCYGELQLLLEKIQFNSEQDCLWFAGDLINRGPKSLEVLRFIKNLGEKHKVVLGNHDLHCLAVASGVRKASNDDTLQEILQAPDCDELMDWLRHQALFYYDPTLNVAMVHAGIIPQWDIATSQLRAREVEGVLQGENYLELLKEMYGHEPNQWKDSLTGNQRLRLIINIFTRLRVCSEQGECDFSYKGKPGDQKMPFQPWYDVYNNRQELDCDIVFGHWAALLGFVQTKRIHGLDTGCVWGNKLRTMRLDDKKIFEVASLHK